MFSFLKRPGSDGLGVAFSDREGGVSTGGFASLNLGRTEEDDLAAVRRNYELVRAELELTQIVTVAQVHGADVYEVDETVLASWGIDQHLGSVATGVRLREADALVTRLRGVALCIRVADCMPVVFADPGAGVIGVAHAGRVGLAAGVLPATVAALRRLGAEHIHAWIGPHICGSCYEVPAEMRAEVSAALPGAYATTSWGTPAVDLGAAGQHQLRSLGCTVERHDPCTLTTAELHSHRRDGAGAGRMAAFVWLN